MDFAPEPYTLGDGFSTPLTTQQSSNHSLVPSPVILPSSPVGDRGLAQQLSLSNPVNISTGLNLMDNFNYNKLSSVNLASTPYEEFSLFKGRYLDRYL